MATILNIETATKNCSVSLSKNGKVIALKELNEGQFSHAEKLHTFIENVIGEAGITFQDIDAVSVSKGPGSYTGLRIGVSTAKGLCFSLDKPLLSVETLTLLANAIDVAENEFIIPLIDARRMEVYSAVFDHNHQLIKETSAEIIDESSFLEYLNKGKVYFLGDGSEKCKNVILHKNAVFLDDYFPSAKYMSELSSEKYNKKEIEDLAYFEPFYLKDFIAGIPKKLF
ncbi:MAG: tRNA (adenosine(37)-N6)-threonylcarbamoyltransferase complex dimerization subunit type 1 TsaB [Bacteroidota bacterium]